MNKIFYIVLFILLANPIISFCQEQNQKTKIASLEIMPFDVDKAVTETISQVIALKLGEYKQFQVISKTEIKAMLGYEYEKKTIGCEEDISCLAEIGGAMGVEYIVTGTLGKMEETYVLNLMMIKITDATVNNRVSVSWKGESSGLVELISPYIKFLIEKEKSSTYKGKIDILVNKPMANVIVDNKQLGKSPLKKQIELSIGKHSVHITKNGYIDFTKDIVIKKDISSILSVSLKDKPKILPWYKKWWIWTIAGTVVTSVSAAFILSQPENGGNNSGIQIEVPEYPGGGS